MKKHSITILWTIIICGGTFLFANKYKSSTIPTLPPENLHNIEETTPETNTKENSSEVEEITLEDTKTFAQHIKEGDRLFAMFYYNSAIEEYLKATQKNESSSDAKRRLAEAYIKNNQPELAETYFRKALEIAKTSNEIKLGLARSLLNQGKKEEAKTLIWEIPNEYLPAKYYKAITLVIYEKPNEAEKIFKELEKQENTDDSIKEKSEIFLKAFENASLVPDDPLYAKLQYYFALSKNGEQVSAIPLLFSIVNEKNNYRDAWIVLGYSYLSSGKIKEAIDSLLQARELDSEKPETNFYLGISYFANNEFEKALYYLQKAKSLKFPDTNLIELKMAEIYSARNDFINAEEKYESLLKNGNTNIAIYENLININLEQLNNPKKAYTYAEKLYKDHPSNPLTFILISKIYIEAKSLKLAKEFITQALEMDQTIPEIYLVMGKISELEGKKLMAKEYYNTAYIMGYNSIIAKKATERLNLINASLSNSNYQVNLLNQ
jgi:Flp pilus assembly protein TadD